MDTRDAQPPDPRDFYVNDEGLIVFTRDYHLKRGFCCRSGCLHCPWDYRKPRRNGAVGSED